MKQSILYTRTTTKILHITLPLLCVLTLSGCLSPNSESKDPTDIPPDALIVDFTENIGSSQEPDAGDVESSDNSTEVTPEPVNLIQPLGTTLSERIDVPEGYSRIAADEGSFTSFIRNYEMKPDGSPVMMYDGTEKHNQNDHVAVFNMDMVSGDLQQCADSIMRIYAEYFYMNNLKEKIQFHFVNGFLCDYQTYSSGNRVQVSGNSVSWATTAATDDSFAILEQYLKTVFMYASTLSMEQESKETSLEQLQVGDVFIYGGSPGHVVMVADICKNGDKTAFLLAQGYMPAQEFHVLKNIAHDGDPWYYEDEVIYPFVTPEYTFQEGSLRHLTYAD